jgi:hypothetical protein
LKVVVENGVEGEEFGLVSVALAEAVLGWRDQLVVREPIPVRDALHGPVGSLLSPPGLDLDDLKFVHYA